MKQIITTECTRTAIFQLLWPQAISKLAQRERERERERAYTIIYHTMYLFSSRSNNVSNNMVAIVNRQSPRLFSVVYEAKGMNVCTHVPRTCVHKQSKKLRV